MSDTSTPSEPSPHTTSDGTIVEPENSTVSDWFGQETERDAAAAEAAMEQAQGDPAEAEKIFESTRPEHESEQYKVPESERPS